MSGKRTILVLGGSGFIGRHFEVCFRRCGLEADYKLVGVGRNEEGYSPSEGTRFRHIDLEVPRQLQQVLSEERPEFIVNLVGAYGQNDLDALFASNVQVSRCLFEAIQALTLPVEKVLVVGSAAEYGLPLENPIREDAPLHPLSPYGLTKSIQTTLALYFHRVAGIPIVVARPFNIIGEGLSNRLSIGHFMSQIHAAEDGGTIRVGNIDTSRDFLDIRDVAMGFLNLLFHGHPGEVYNVCSGVPTRIGDVLDQLIRQSGKRLRIEVDPGLFKANDVSCVYGDPQKLRALMARATAGTP
jgi:GDP-4-dehydro-6-deoxy-D-mannose reductase